MGLQTAKSMGYIDVDWNKIRGDAIKPLDTVSAIWFDDTTLLVLSGELYLSALTVRFCKFH